MPKIPNNPFGGTTSGSFPGPSSFGHHSGITCQVCVDLCPSGPDTATCRRCGRTSHYMNFIQELRHMLMRYEGHQLPSGVSHAHVNLGTIPGDIDDIKKKLDELEKALSVFSDVLKSAVQS